MSELLTYLVTWLGGAATTALLLFADRRRLDGESRARGWNSATTAIVLSGFFVPPPFMFFAHVWVTRAGPWYRRLGLALTGLVVSLGFYLLVASAVLWVLAEVGLVDPS